MSYQPRHVRALYLRTRLEATPGVSEAPLGSGDDFPNTIRSLGFSLEEREYSETRGPGSRMIQSQEMLARRYPVRTEFEVHSGAWLLGALWDATNDEVYSHTFELCNEANYGWAFTGVKCNSLRLSASERGILVAEADWLALSAQAAGGFTWDAPQHRPYVFARGVFAVEGVGGDVTGVDLRVDNNLQESYPMQAALPAVGYEYDPKYLIAGGFRVACDLAMRTPFDISYEADDLSAVLIFESAFGLLTINLTDGVFRSQALDAPQDDLISYTVPMVFRDISIVET